jgi:hypothetical protein
MSFLRFIALNTIIVAVILIRSTGHANPVSTIIAFGTLLQVVNVFARDAFAAYCGVSISVTFITEQIVNLCGIINFVNPAILANPTIAIGAFNIRDGLTTAYLF